MIEYSEALQESLEYFDGDELAAKVFVDKYALRDGEGNLVESTPHDMHVRLANELARVENGKFKDPLSFDQIYGLLDHFRRLVPQGSPMYGIGNKYQYVTVSNCYCLPSPPDSYGGILKADQELVQISKRRGGVGMDLSNLRPSGTRTQNAAHSSTGVVSFMARYSHSIREVGQCIARGQRVLTTDGLRAIEDVNPGDKVWTKKGWIRVNQVFENGTKRVYRIRTKYGYEVVTSMDHHFITEVNGSLSECPLSELRVGDPIALLPGTHTEQAYVDLDTREYVSRNPKPMKMHHLPAVLDEDLAYLLGYVYGNGCVTFDKFNEPSVLTISCPESRPDIIDRVGGLIDKVFQFAVQHRPGDGRVVCFNISSKNILSFLQSNQILKGYSSEILFPSKVIHSRSSVQMAFIAGFFDADGSISNGKAGYRFSSTSLDFLHQIQVLLAANGIISKISREDRVLLGWNDIYNLRVVGAGSQTRFVEQMGVSIKVKSRPHISKRDCILTLHRANGLGVKHNLYSYVPSNDQNLSLNCYDRLGREVDLPEIPLIRDEISIIEDAGEQPTYDLSLEEEHLFWCESTYVHNSGRRGALMLTLSVHHPEILDFATAKVDLTKVTGANISVRLTDEFLKAVEDDRDYEQRFPVDSATPRISRMVSARKVWKKIIETAHATAEPGLIFWDAVIRESPADCYSHKHMYFKTICTNPCSELPLSIDSCRLLAINLLGYVVNSFSQDAYFDYDRFAEDAKLAQRLMDDIIDLDIESIDRIIDKIDRDPEEEALKRVEREMWENFRKSAVEGRRTGTGITALGDVIAALGIRYGSEESIDITGKIYRTLKLSCYRSSVEMAKEIGAFPIWDPSCETACPFLLRIREDDPELYDDMNKYGRRNISLLTTAPTGSLSCLTRTTAGIEPLFALSFIRRKKLSPDDNRSKVDFVDQSGDRWQEFTVYHPQLQMWMDAVGQSDINQSPYADAIAEKIDWVNRVKLQAIAQKNIDHAISSCLAKGSLIQTNHGLYDIEEIVGDSAVGTFTDVNEELLSINKNGDLARITQGYNNGVSPTLILRMPGHRELQCTPNHRLVVIDENYDLVWREASQIAVGDYVVGRKGLCLGGGTTNLETMVGTPFYHEKKSRSRMVRIPVSMTSDLARLIGYLCSDGGVSVNGIFLSQIENEVCDDFERIVMDIFDVKCIRQYDTRSPGLCSVLANSKELRTFFQWLGLKDHDHLEVPVVIRHSGPIYVRQFIRGLTLDGGVIEDDICIMNSVCKGFLVQVQYLLTNIGIDANLQLSVKAGYHTFPDGYTSPVQDVWKLYISDRRDIEVFAHSIGFAETRKQLKKVRAARMKPPGEIPDYGIRMRFREEVISRVRSLSIYNIVRKITYSPIGRALSRESLLEMIDCGFVCPDYLTDPTYVFRRVTEIKDGGEVPTYDLSVPEGNSYIANGLLSHNTINLPEDTPVDKVAKIYETAWKSGCKGITVYRNNCRTGVLIGIDDHNKDKIKKTQAVKRPKELPCEVHHTTGKGEKFFVIIGLLNGDPYEVFGAKDSLGKTISHGVCVKNGKGNYKLLSQDGEIIAEDITADCTDDQEALLRMVSTSLRHGADIGFVTHQLEKVKGDMQVFAKCLGRILKKYIPDGSVVSGAVCQECKGANLVRESGCVICKQCGWSKCF